MTREETIALIAAMKRPIGPWRPQWFRRQGAPRAAYEWSRQKERNELLDEIIAELSEEL